MRSGKSALWHDSVRYITLVNDWDPGRNVPVTSNPYLKQVEADPLMLVDDLRQWMKKLPNRQKILNLRIREWFENASNASDLKFESTMLTHD